MYIIVISGTNITLVVSMIFLVARRWWSPRWAALLALALSTPLMVWLARTAYTDPRSDPARTRG